MSPARARSRRRKTARRKGSIDAEAAPSAAARTAGGVSARGIGGPSTELVVYVHGIGNKPIESVLKRQWDVALFNGNEMGDRTRMAYWVNRDRYPVPVPSDESDADRIDPQSLEVRSLALRPAAGDAKEEIERELDAVTRDPRRRAVLRAIAARMAATPVPASDDARARALEVREKVIPFLPESARRLITRVLTGTFLRDVHDFLFDAAERERMCGILADRLTQGAGPFVVVAHSQGTMIAYKTLFDLAKTRPDLEVPLFVTMGSPLGLQEVVDRIRAFVGVPKGRLPVPGCVKDWINVADRFDPVAADQTLAHDYRIPDPARNEDHGFGVNPDWSRDPHSATGYLSTPFVRDHVWNTFGPDFAQQVRAFVVARDLHAAIADAPGERHAVLIELQDDARLGIGATRERIVRRIGEIAKRKKIPLDRYEVEPLTRYVAARLTRDEVEALQAEFRSLEIAKLWRDGVKRALIFDSIKTVQVASAQLGYGARGRDIEWAVLDTGIRADHPHFRRGKESNVVAEWNCTRRGPLVASRSTPHPAADGDGHGTHVCGIIAGEFPVELRSREAPELPPVRLRGMAPEAKLHVYKVLDDQGTGQDSWIIKALDHVARVNEESGRLRIHGLNLSLGSSFDPEVFGCGHTPLCEELRRLWRQGVLVCVAAGNEGYAVLRSAEGPVEANMDLSIGDPANLDDCIAIGSVHKTNPHTYGVSYFSSRGPTADGRRKPDVVAPGERIVSALNRFVPRPLESAVLEDYYVEMGGTSMACPHVSGLLAAFLSARREFIGHPDRVKRILLANCTDLDRDPYIQGFGLPNLTKMLLET